MKELSERGRHWEGIIREHADSGTSVRAFCLERGLARCSFYWWRRELREVGGADSRGEEAAASGAGFVELVPSQRSPVHGGSGVTVRLDDRISVVVDRGFDRGALSAVMAVLRESDPCSR